MTWYYTINTITEWPLKRRTVRQRIVNRYRAILAWIALTTFIFHQNGVI